MTEALFSLKFEISSRADPFILGTLTAEVGQSSLPIGGYCTLSDFYNGMSYIVSTEGQRQQLSLMHHHPSSVLHAINAYLFQGESSPLIEETDSPHERLGFLPAFPRCDATDECTAYLLEGEAHDLLLWCPWFNSTVEAIDLPVGYYFDVVREFLSQYEREVACS